VWPGIGWMHAIGVAHPRLIFVDFGPLRQCLPIAAAIGMARWLHNGFPSTPAEASRGRQ